MVARLTVVVPVYQNEGSIAETCRGIAAVFDRHKDEVICDFVLVNDGSTDRSWEVMQELQAADPTRITLLTLTRNFGQLSALLAGYTHARGDCVATISADLQDPPELIWEMFCAWKQGHKLVVGNRVARNDGWISDRISELSWTLLRRYAVPNIPRGGFDFFLMDRVLRDHYIRDPEQDIFMQGRLLYFGYRPFVIPYERRKRTVGRSQTSLGRKIKYMIDGFVGYSFLPLRIVSVLGVSIFFGAMFYGVYVVCRVTFFGSRVEGWASLMVVILCLNGVQLLAIGVIGEYLWRTIEEARKRPHYVIAETKLPDKGADEQ